ncbi:diguanylate cyclase/phosphodiesterase (GGDEF & EAL domains) with PAS/PAC sensor(s), partial [hydrothermal vent metagenome]
MVKPETPFAGARYGLGRKLIIYILLFSSFVTLIGTSLQLYVDYVKDKRLLDERMSQIENSYLETLTNAMWISNKNLLSIQLKGILQLPDIEYVDIRADGEALISLGKPQTENFVSRNFPMLYEYKGKKINLGALQVVASLEGIQRRLLDRVVIILTTQAIKTFLVSAFIFLVFYFLIGVHLTSLAAYTRSLDLESLGAPFRLNRQRNKKGREDELDFLESSINKMRVKLQDSYAQRKRAEEEIEHQKTMFESIFNGVADAIVFTDTQRKIITCNAGFTKILGYSPQDIVGKETGVFYESWDIYHKMGEERYNLSAEEKLKPYVVDYKRKNGTMFPGETIGTIMRNHSGEIVGFLGVIRDITERIKAERELARHRYHLEELVEARTNELTSVNKELESFAYSVSHDLRAPLRAIDGFSKILLDDYGDKMEDGAKNYLGRVRAATGRMALLIDDLLTLSRVTRARMMSGQVDLSRLAHDVADDLRKECPECNVEFAIEEGLVAQG